MPCGIPALDGFFMTSLTVPALAVRALDVKRSAPPGSALRCSVVHVAGRAVGGRRWRVAVALAAGAL